MQYLLPMANIRTSKLFNSLERKQPTFVVISVFPTRITGVEKAIEPLGKSDKRLLAAFNLPKKNAAHPGSLMRGSGNRRQVGRIF